MPVRCACPAVRRRRPVRDVRPAPVRKRVAAAAVVESTRAPVLAFPASLGKWRNGRRARFRSVCPKGRGGSTPPLPTLVETDGQGPAGVTARGAFVVRAVAGRRKV